MEWLRDDLCIIGSATECDELAASCEDSGGTWFVPALFGLGTPEWDYGARGTLLGITRGTGRPQVARAVLEGIAHRGIDLVEAAEADAGCSIETLRVDGGMSKSAVLTQALADAGGRPVEVARTAESTTLGAGFLAGVELGMWSDLAEATSTLRPPTVVAPRRTLDRPGWTAARQRALGTIPELSVLEF
jgi:glycerol kinase